MKRVKLDGLERLLEEFVFEESVPCWEELIDALNILGCSDDQIIEICLDAMKRL